VNLSPAASAIEGQKSILAAHLSMAGGAYHLKPNNLIVNCKIMEFKKIKKYSAALVLLAAPNVYAKELTYAQANAFYDLSKYGPSNLVCGDILRSAKHKEGALVLTNEDKYSFGYSLRYLGGAYIGGTINGGIDSAVGVSILDKANSWANQLYKACSKSNTDHLYKAIQRVVLEPVDPESIYGYQMDCKRYLEVNLAHTFPAVMPKITPEIAGARFYDSDSFLSMMSDAFFLEGLLNVSGGSLYNELNEKIVAACNANNGNSKIVDIIRLISSEGA